MTRTLLLFLSLVPFWLIACSGEDSESDDGSSSETEEEAEAEEEEGNVSANGGSGGSDNGGSGGDSGSSEPGNLVGTVSYAGAAPTNPVLDMSSKPEHAEHCMKASDKNARGFVVGPGGGLANVFVEVRKAGEGWAPTSALGPSDQLHCRYEPHVMVVPVGREIEFKNSDPFLHNVHFYCRKNPQANFGVPENGKKSVTLEYEEKISVKCDVHPWMASWVIATGNPFHALTGADGSFRIDGVPAGEYEVRFWHEELGMLKKKDVVIGGGDTSLSVDSGGDWQE